MPLCHILHTALLLAAQAVAIAVTTSKHCVELEISVPVIANNTDFTIPRVDNDTQAVQWALDFSIWSALTPAQRDNGSYPINRNFKINAELCVPSSKTDKSDILHIAVQGNGWDRRYWDIRAQPEHHQYVDAAIREGYSVPMFDRIGAGKSEHPDPYKLVQVATEVEILFQLTEMARKRTLLTSAEAVGTTGAQVKEPLPKHIVHVGHPYGSLLILGLLIQHGDMSDAALLTGACPKSTHYGQVQVVTFEHEYAGDDPTRFGDFGSGYIILTTENTLQKLYFVEDTLDLELLAYTEKVKQPEAVALYASAGQAFANQVPLYRGPVLMLVGKFDLINCDGNCTGMYSEESSRSRTLPGASNLTVHLQPNTGHALTVAKNATGTFEVMFEYLHSFGV